MTTEEKVVYFKFVGDETIGIASEVVAIAQAELEKFPETYLSALAKPAWNNKNQGGIEENPLEVNLTDDLKETWHPRIVDCVCQRYKGVPMELPVGVELHELSRVLLFLNLFSEKEMESIRSTTCTPAQKLRAKAFINFLKNSSIAFSSICDQLAAVGARSGHFVFDKPDTEHTLPALREDSGIDLYEIIPYFETRETIYSQYAWASEETYRRFFSKRLKEMEFSARWSFRSFFEDIDYFVELWVLEVSVDNPEPIAKRRRTA